MTRFLECLDVILDLEGEPTNDPRDPGGLTKFGISKRSHPSVDIMNLTKEEAADIYRREYWNPIHGDALPAGLDLLVFDSAVNQGVKPAVLMLQLAAGAQGDSVMGSETLAAVNRKPKEEVAIMFAARRAKRYAVNPNVGIYGTGWYKRLFVVFSLASKDLQCRT